MLKTDAYRKPTIFLVVLVATLWVPAQVHADIISPPEEACLGKEAGDPCSFSVYFSSDDIKEGTCIEYKCRRGPFGPKDSTCISCEPDDEEKADDHATDGKSNVADDEGESDADLSDASTPEVGDTDSSARDTQDASDDQSLGAGPLRDDLKVTKTKNDTERSEMPADARSVSVSRKTASQPAVASQKTSDDEEDSTAVSWGLFIMLGSVTIGLSLAFIGTRDFEAPK